MDTQLREGHGVEICMFPLSHTVLFIRWPAYYDVWFKFLAAVCVQCGMLYKLYIVYGVSFSFSAPSFWV